jgi:hypothetical protein
MAVQIFIGTFLSLRNHQHIYEPCYRNLFYWIFVPLVQQMLDRFCAYWNTHKIRCQKNKQLPSSHSPDVACMNPELFGGQDCRITVPKDALDRVREILTAQVGPRDQHLRWCTQDFHDQADTAYEAIGSPTLTLDSAWVVFTQMLVVLH